MKITKAELIELGACEEGLDRFITQTNDTDEPVEVSSLVGGENIYSDLLWLAGKKLPTERIVRFVCDCALINIEKIKPYTDEYEIIVKFLSNPTGGAHVATAATTAATTAAAAAAAVRAAARTDVATRAVATRVAIAARVAAVNAINAVTNIADSAADAAAYARAAYAASSGSRDKVNKLLMELFS